MSNPIAVILRFNGDPDDLLGRFEQARKSWIETQGDGNNPPTFFAICKAQEGIVLVTGWETEEDHKAFRKQMMPHLQAAGLGRPDDHEHFRIARRMGPHPGPSVLSTPMKRPRLPTEYGRSAYADLGQATFIAALDVLVALAALWRLPPRPAISRRAACN